MYLSFPVCLHLSLRPIIISGAITRSFRSVYVYVFVHLITYKLYLAFVLKLFILWVIGNSVKFFL